MKWLDLTLETPPENLACDEALLDTCEDGFAHEILRFWEPRHHFVVVGYANKVNTEVNLAACSALAIPVFRRCSGGGTVLQGPGCLNYSLVLRIDDARTAGVTQTNRFVMQKNANALSRLLSETVQVQGHTDLAVRSLKFSGNAQRRRRRFLLFHGTFLIDADISLMSQVLPLPSQMPGYRQRRSHSEFLRNLNCEPAQVKEALRNAWQATDPLLPQEQPLSEALVEDKYARPEWNLKF